MSQDYGDGPGTLSFEPSNVPGHPQVPFHTGIDLICARGTPVLAAANGVVAQITVSTIGLWQPDQTLP
jgi:murein DD-endopeptidase MepM/ murein hydrolase activator NlpD